MHAITDLIAAETKYRQLVELAQEGIWVVDEDNQTRFTNTPLAEMFGNTPDEMIGKSLFDFMDSDGKAIANRCIQRCKQGIKEQHDFKFITKDGRQIYTTLATAPIIDDAGNYRGAIAGIIDTTKRQEALRALKKSQRERHNLLQTVQCGIVVHAADTAVVETNPEATRQFGIPRKDLIGKKTIDGDWPFIAEDGTLLPVEKYPVHIVKRTLKPLSDYIIGLEGPDRENPIWLSVNAMPNFHEDGRLAQVIVSSVDITELKRTQAQLDRMRQELIQAHKMESIGNLAGGIAHDFNNKISEETVAEIGIRAFVYKPVVKKDMAQTVRKVLDAARSQSQVCQATRRQSVPLWLRFDLCRNKG